MFAIRIGGCGDKTSGLDAAVALGRIEADEVKGDVLEDGEVMCGMLGTGAHLIIGEGDVHAPMQAILDRPMGPNSREQPGRIGRQAAEVETPLNGGFALDAALGLDHGKGLEVVPLLGPGQTIDLVEGPAAADFDPPVIFLDGFRYGVRRALRHGLELGEEVPDRIGQERLIVLDRQHVIGASVTNRLGDIGLRAH